MRNCLSKCGAFSVQVCDGSSYKNKENDRKSVLTSNMVYFQTRSAITYSLHSSHLTKYHQNYRARRKNVFLKHFGGGLYNLFYIIFQIAQNE